MYIGVKTVHCLDLEYRNVQLGTSPFCFTSSATPVPESYFYISSSWVLIKLHTCNQLPKLLGSAINICCGGIPQDMWWKLHRIYGVGLVCLFPNIPLFQVNHVIVL